MKSKMTLAIMATMAGLSALGTTVRGQTPSTNPPVKADTTVTVGLSTEAQAARLDKVVKLTDDQKTKVKAALEDRNKAIEELKAQKMEWAQRRAAAKAIREQEDADLKDILTAEQYAKYQTSGQRPSKK